PANNWTPVNLSTTTGGPTSVASASGALPIYNTTDTYGTTKGTGTRTDSNSSSIVLAVAMDGANNGTTFTDESATIKGSGSAKTISVVNNTKTVTAQSKYYGSSGYFDGVDDYLLLPATTDFQFGSGDFTIETWFYPNSNARMALYHGSFGTDWSVGIDYSATIAAGNDSLVDVPTNGAQTDTGVGAEVRGNYCTLNPLNTGDTHTLSNGNLDTTLSGSTSSKTSIGTIGVSSGKWYYEATVGSGGSGYYPGFGFDTNPLPGSQSGSNATGYLYMRTGEKFNNSTLSSYGSSFTSGDVIGVALNLDAGTIIFYKNGVSQGQAFSSISGTALPVVIGFSSGGASMNFGQRAFAYTAPSGFKALCTANLPAPL
ncbi:hypothetical protein EBZ38_17325, partial [bacterium]|nr:hypothetical protein [bacterium]